MALKRRRREQKGDIDISPLIDVVFILLIFFMVSTTFIKDAQIAIDRPSAKSGAKTNAESLRVYLDREGGVHIDDAPVKPWMVQSRVRDFLRDGSGAGVLVIADRNVEAQKLIEVVDQCRLAGATDVGVVTDREA
ncbi:MAG: biopolymer transporter ExbD [Myxococcales bacterium]|nr:biopolymer transporter ExbD [Myxococcales bacterium]